MGFKGWSGGEGMILTYASSELDSGEFSSRGVGPVLEVAPMLWLMRQCPGKCRSIR